MTARDLRPSLTLALWFYPVWWVASTLFSLSSRRGSWQLSPYGFFPGGPPGRPLAFRLTLALALTLVLVWALRRRPGAAGLLLLASATAIGFQSAFDLFQLPDAPRYALLGLILLLAAAGFHLAASAGSYWVRFVQNLILTLPWAAIMLSATRPRNFGAYFGLALLPSAILGAMGRGGGQPLAFRWSALVAPIVLTMTILGASRWSEEQARREWDARLESELKAVTPVAALPRPARFFQRGISLLGDGRDGYFPQPTARLLDELKAYHVDSIAAVPYGYGTRDGGPIEFDQRRDRLFEALGHLARARGMRVFLKPQVWAQGFPGDIAIADAGRRAAWFASYTRFIEHWARMANAMHADVFCVGTEFGRMSVYETEWRAIIARVRRIYRGPLVYAAVQGPEFETLKFWDALDYIGLNNYYPLPDSLDTSELVRKVETVQGRFGKPVLLTEVGFASVTAPHREPWAEPRREISLEDQARCYEAIFRAFHGKPWFHGMYWWKVSTNGRGGPEDRSMTPWRKPAMGVIGQWYRRMASGGG